MRAGGYTVHQSLTAEAAAVLKLSLGLARRRGHAQVTPLHVAFTLLSSSSSSPLFTFSAAPAATTPSSYTYGLLRRACIKSHPTNAAAACSPAVSHPLQCRALELCFNVALNRLPTTNVVGGPHCSPLSSSSSSSASSASSTSFSASLVQPNPTLSNALVAALKRAQANQRRGCIELQSQQPPPPPPLQSSQQQPLLAIKVELDQLIISILDDPSVSRVMREAGFSSAAVKSNLEEESVMLLGLGYHSSSSPSSPATAVQPQFFLEPYIDFPTHANGGGAGGLGPAPAQFMSQPGIGSSCKEEDVRAIMEVMMRKQGRRTNPVVVADSVSVAEASVAELMGRLEKGQVPEELRGAHVLRLHFSYVHVRLMTRADVDARVAELRRSVDAVAGAKAGLLIYVDDMRWAVDEDDALTDFSPVKHMVADLARLLRELPAEARGRAWLMTAASYQTYMRFHRKNPSLEATWALQPVLVPAGACTGLALGPRAPPAPTGVPSSAMELASGEEDGVPALCSECAKNYKKEASLVRAKAEDTNLALTYFPSWPRADEPRTSHKDDLMELQMKWTKLCQRLHSHSNLQTHQSNVAAMPWWSASSPDQMKQQIEPKQGSAGLCLTFDTPIDDSTSKSDQDVKTTLALGSHILPDSATTSQEGHCHKSEGLDEPVVEELNAAISMDDRRLWLEKPLFADLKRKAEGSQPSWESKRQRNSTGQSGVDLNLCADEEDGGDSEEEPVPSDLTNEGESNREPGHRHDSQDTIIDSRD